MVKKVSLQFYTRNFAVTVIIKANMDTSPGALDHIGAN